MCFFVRSMIMASRMWNRTAWGQQSPSARRPLTAWGQQSPLPTGRPEHARKQFTGPPDSNYNPRSVVRKGGVWKKGSFSHSPKRNWVNLKITFFYILNQLLNRKCRRQGSLLPQFLELQQLEVSPTHRMSSPKWVIEVCQSNPISILDFKNTKI